MMTTTDRIVVPLVLPCEGYDEFIRNFGTGKPVIVPQLGTLCEVPRSCQGSALDIVLVARIWHLKETALTKWQELNGLYAFNDRREPRLLFGKGKDRRPKWGQPGRGRKRKERLAARASNKVSTLQC